MNMYSNCSGGKFRVINPVSILNKSIAGSYRLVRVADGPITARCRFIKNVSWVMMNSELMFSHS